MQKGQLVIVFWDDIQAILHTDEDLNLAPAKSVGWVRRNNKKALELENSCYLDGSKVRDGITIPKGCINKIIEIGT